MNDNIHLVIPDNWSDEQALTIFDFLDKLRDKCGLNIRKESSGSCVWKRADLNWNWI